MKLFDREFNHSAVKLSRIYYCISGSILQATAIGSKDLWQKVGDGGGMLEKFLWVRYND